MLFTDLFFYYYFFGGGWVGGDWGLKVTLVYACFVYVFIYINHK